MLDPEDGFLPDTLFWKFLRPTKYMWSPASSCIDKMWNDLEKMFAAMCSAVCFEVVASLSDQF